MANRLIRCVAAVLLAGTVAAGCGSKKKQAAGQQQQAPPQYYPTAVVHEGDATLAQVFPATIRGQEDIDIMPRLDGYIQRIFVDEGAVVKKGQPLFSIDSPSAVQGLQSAQASVTTAEANLNTAQLNVNRMQPLAEQNIISNVQLETYRNQYESALASLQSAQATLQQARTTMGWATVTSPVDGVVGEIPYRQGSLVTSATVLTTVANIANVYAYFSLNEKELLELLGRYDGDTQQEKIDNMPEVTLTLADGSVYPFTGRIETISGVVNTATGSASLRAEFPNPDGTLRSGTSGKVTVPDTVHDVFTIPQRATFSQLDKTLVYKVQGDSVVQAIITVEALPDGQTYAVTEGLQEGDRIVTDGVATLHNGSKISLTPPARDSLPAGSVTAQTTGSVTTPPSGLETGQTSGGNSRSATAERSRK
ncbi:MAG: efflux RND transporter periplasmic adaptor subunit [Rikenellaceae bacterium]|nr:efflux RND transporter periplasmic adaptor subunit [Rikenellaceae bacterium]